LVGKKARDRLQFLPAGDRELMHPYLIKGKEFPRDLEEFGKRMLEYVQLDVKIARLRLLKKDLKEQAQRGASKSSKHLGTLHCSLVCIAFVTSSIFTEYLCDGRFIVPNVDVYVIAASGLS